MFLIVHDFQFSCHTPGPTVRIFHFPHFSVFLAIFQVKQWFCLIFHFFSVFSPYFRSYRVHFSFSTFFSVPRHISILTVYVFLFSMILSFLALLQVLKCAFLIFHVFGSFLPYSRSYSVFLSFSTLFSFHAIFHISCHIPGAFLIFLVFQYFSPYFTSYSVCISFSMIFCFLAIFQVLQCAFLFFHIFQYFCHIPGQTVFFVSVSNFF